MSESEKAAPSPIRLGLVGTGGFARQTIDLLGECPDIRVAAAADVDRESVEQVAQQFGAAAYVDVRSMMIESGIDAVLMSLPHHRYPEYVRLAAQQGLHVLKEKPLARSFDEALALVDAFDRAGRVFMIGTQRRFHPGFVALKSALPEAGRAFLVRSRFLFNWRPDFGWRGERHKAGFGALGDAGYHNIDLLNWLFGPPQEVFALHSGRNREDPLHPYDTDDTGLCTLNYAGGLIGCLTCSWVTQPNVLDVIVHGTRATLTATPERFQQIDLSGKVVADRRTGPARTARQTVLAKMAAFVAAIRSGGASYPCSARENLLNQAVVEAAYLSGRTGQVQLPARVFELRNRSIEECTMPRGPEATEARPARRRV